ncbi:MAG TPA: alpha/beta fold hydrolase [Acidimicrobiales bacterium]|nr:alpha/beta fold hydrolase [Acidimicrobiales bacterium]
MAGAGQGPLIATVDIGLLHGFAAGPFTWREVVDRLATNHRVAVLDRPWASLGEQVTATLDEIGRHGLDRPVLMGHSAGAEVAVATAVAAPDRVGALVLIGPVIGRGPPRLAVAAARLPGAGYIGPRLVRSGTRFLGPVLRSMWHDPRNVTSEVVEGYRRPLRQPGVAEALWRMTGVAGRDSSLLEAAGGLEHPCLTLIGEGDRLAAPIAMPRNRTVWIAECGHLPHEEQPARVLAEVGAFLAQLP